MRMLACAAASLALILAGTLVMEWYRTGNETGRIAIDLNSMRICSPVALCSTASLHLLPGMFPPLAAVVLWSSLVFAGLVAFQTAARLLSGNASAPLSKLGYLFALMTIATLVAAAYMFGPETEDPSGVIAELGGSLHRTWAPLTLLVGLLIGFAALYMAVATDAGGLGADYKPITLTPAPATLPGGAAPRLGAERPPPEPATIRRSPTAPIYGGRAPGQPAGAGRADPAGSAPEPSRTRTGQFEAVAPVPDAIAIGSTRTKLAAGLTGRSQPRTTAMPPLSRTRTAQFPAVAPATGGEPAPPARRTGQFAAAGPDSPVTGQPLPSRSRTGQHSAVGPMHAATGQRAATERGTTGQFQPVSRAKTASIPPVPEHLRRRLAYVAITAELTSGGLDARREDGSSRLVLWRDVVGVVARRMPAVYDSTTFVDIISTAGSTLRIVPWTRFTGEVIEGEGDSRSRGVVQRVAAMCPGARLDHATLMFLDTGEAAQIPDLEALQAHDDHLA